jgi:hypothetical protein
MICCVAVCVRFLSFSGVEMPHVTKMEFAGKELHVFRRPKGLFVSMAELQAHNFPLFALDK